MHIYLPIYEHIIDIHDAVIDVSGGRPGILDKKVIEAAVDRPKTFLSYNPNSDIHTVCAVLLDSLARNHAFVEGNKRSALLTVILTYSLNNVTLRFDKSMNRDFEELVLWVVLKKPEILDITEKLRSLSLVYGESGANELIRRLKAFLTPFNN